MYILEWINHINHTFISNKNISSYWCDVLTEANINTFLIMSISLFKLATSRAVKKPGIIVKFDS